MNFVRTTWRHKKRSSFPAIPRTITRQVLKQRSAQTGLAIAILLIVSILAGPLLSPYQPDEINLKEKLSPPSIKHWLGTDQFGRDQLTRLLAGGRRSLGAALLVLSIALVISLAIGIGAGMAGGILDAITMRIIDVMLALPRLVLALAVVGVLGVGFENLLLALVATLWAYYAKLARSYVRLARRRQDVVVDRLAGIGWTRIILGHIVPGVLMQLAIIATLDLGSIIISIAGLSFLGLGVQPPEAEWGAMIAESRLYFTTAPWLLIAPTVFIFFSVISANLIGNSIRNSTDYRQVP